MIKNLLAVLFAGFLLANIHAQTALTSADWQTDLRFLQRTVHEDYPFLFKKIAAKDWDAGVEKLYAAIPNLQGHEIVAGIGRMVSAFQYGHTDIDWSGGPVKHHVAPLNLYWFSDGVYIEGAHKDYEKMLGAKVLKIEGMPVEQAIAAIRPLVPVENEQYFKAYGAMDFLLVPEALHAQKVTKSLKNTISMTLEKDGKTFDQTFAAVDPYHFPKRYGFVEPGNDWVSIRNQNQTPAYLKNLDKIYYYEYLPDQKTVYVRHSQIQDDPQEPIPAFYERLFDFIEKNEVERLVLDVRLNGGGNNYKNKPIVTGVLRCEKINQPGKFFVLLGRRTFSACQNLVNELQTYTNAVFVGEPTSENINFYGDNRRIELPKSKIPVFLSFAWWQDKPQWENADWLAPHIAVDLSFNDYYTNRDPVLDAALAFNGKDFILDPIGRLKELFAAKKIDELEALATQMVKDPKYRFVDFEDQINEAGYDLMAKNQLEPALYVLQLNTKLFPNSANAWDSLGEVNWKSGKKEEAVSFYNKAIQLDPKGSTGENARKMLKEINGGK